MRTFARIQLWWRRRRSCDACARYHTHIEDLQTYGADGAVDLARRFHAAHLKRDHNTTLDVDAGEHVT